MSESTVSNERAAPFTAMAAKIGLNAENGFGGAFVVVPPGDEIIPVTLLMLDDSANSALFWTNLQTMAAIALQRIEDANRVGGHYR